MSTRNEKLAALYARIGEEKDGYKAVFAVRNELGRLVRYAEKNGYKVVAMGGDAIDTVDGFTELIGNIRAKGHPQPLIIAASMEQLWWGIPALTALQNLQTRMLFADTGKSLDTRMEWLSVAPLMPVFRG